MNTAIIDSDQTPEDEGQDSVTVTREGEQGGNPTPAPPLPNTALGTGLNGEPITVPIELLVAFFIGSLGALALANVKARNNRRVGNPARPVSMAGLAIQPAPLAGTG